MQLLEEESGKVEELWASVGASYQRLEHTLPSGTAPLLQGRMEEELNRSEVTPPLSNHQINLNASHSGACLRWRDVVQELKAEQTRTEQLLLLWKEYRCLSDRCRLLLRRHWEEVRGPWPQPDPQHALHAVEVGLVSNVRAVCPPWSHRPLSKFSVVSEMKHLRIYCSLQE